MVGSNVITGVKSTVKVAAVVVAVPDVLVKTSWYSSQFMAAVPPVIDSVGVVTPL